MGVRLAPIVPQAEAAWCAVRGRLFPPTDAQLTGLAAAGVCGGSALLVTPERHRAGVDARSEPVRLEGTPPGPFGRPPEARDGAASHHDQRRVPEDLAV